MRALRYCLAGFQTLFALFFFSVAVVGLIMIVQVSSKGTPVERTKRTVVVQELGRATVVSVVGGLFAYGFGRRAVRNFRDAG